MSLVLPVYLEQIPAKRLTGNRYTGTGTCLGIPVGNFLGMQYPWVPVTIVRIYGGISGQNSEALLFCLVTYLASDLK